MLHPYKKKAELSLECGHFWLNNDACRPEESKQMVKRHHALRHDGSDTKSEEFIRKAFQAERLPLSLHAL